MIHELVLAHQVLATGSGGGDAITQWSAAIAAVIGAYSALKLARQKTSSDELASTKRERDAFKIKLDEADDREIALRLYIRHERNRLADEFGITLPDPPAGTSRAGGA